MADVGAGFLDPGQLHAQSITGVAPDPVTDAIWTLEDSLYPYATKWLVDTSGNTISYADVFFGTGSNTDNDDGLQNGLDITIGKSNHMYVLDSTTSLGYRIKAFDNVTGQPIGSSTGEHAARSASDRRLYRSGSCGGHGTGRIIVVRKFIRSTGTAVGEDVVFIDRWNNIDPREVRGLFFAQSYISIF